MKIYLKGLNNMKQPDPKLHQLISFLKSGIRIGGGLAAFAGVILTTNAIGAVIILSVAIVIAELVGIIEELV